MSRRFKFWIGVCAVITAIATASFACAVKTGGVEFNQKMMGQAFPPVKVRFPRTRRPEIGNFVSWLSVRIQNINDVIAKQFDRSGTSGTGIPACDGISVNQVIDEFPANAIRFPRTRRPESGNAPTFTQEARRGGQRSELKRLLHLGIALLKMLATACLKRSKHMV